MDFEVLGEIREIEVVAQSASIRDLASLEKRYGRGRWRKLKEVATVCLVHSQTRLAEIHWYEAHGIGRRRFKIKRLLD